MSLYVWIQSSK